MSISKSNNNKKKLSQKYVIYIQRIFGFFTQM